MIDNFKSNTPLLTSKSFIFVQLIIKKRSYEEKFLYLFTVLCTLNMFTACSDDDDSKDPNGLEVNATLGENLDLKYSDVALLGKEISFETKDGKTATLTMKGTFDMSVINGLINGGSKSALILIWFRRNSGELLQRYRMSPDSIGRNIRLKEQIQATDVK